jgi:CRISPR-associated endoribonuclease Cas6
MSPEDFAPLEISRYELRLRAEEACSLPAFLGSTLRGAFGHALKQAASAIDGRVCNGCRAADPCVYHYLFETPVPPGVTQLRGQREAPVPFILSPPIVQNPVRRVWRVPSVQAASAAARSLSDDSRSRIDPQSAIRNPQSATRQSSIRDSQSPSSLSGSPAHGGFARNLSDPQSAIRNPQFAVTSVIFPDQPRRFAAGDTLSFDLSLIGRAIDHLPHVILAVSEMARCGLGAARARFELKEVCLKGAADGRQRIWENGAFLGAQASRLLQVPRPFSELIRERLAELKGPPFEETLSVSPSLESTIADALRELHRGDLSGLNNGNGNNAGRARLGADPQPLTPSPYSLRLRFLAPTRIRVNGDLQTDLSFELLVRNLLRRASTLAAVHGRGSLDLDYRSLIERAVSVETRSSRLVWWDLDRYSNRQQTKMKLGGFIGEIEYEGEAIAEFLPLAVAGELLNIGTGTSFGLGSYQIVTCA